MPVQPCITNSIVETLRLLIAVERIVCRAVKGDGSILRNFNASRGAVALDGRDKSLPSFRLVYQRPVKVVSVLAHAFLLIN